jgi:hypothetical protein
MTRKYLPAATSRASSDGDSDSSGDEEVSREKAVTRLNSLCSTESVQVVEHSSSASASKAKSPAAAARYRFASRPFGAYALVQSTVETKAVTQT